MYGSIVVVLEASDSTQVIDVAKPTGSVARIVS
jgi:hypothetical protein